MRRVSHLRYNFSPINLGFNSSEVETASALRWLKSTLILYEICIRDEC